MSSPPIDGTAPAIVTVRPNKRQKARPCNIRRASSAMDAVMAAGVRMPATVEIVASATVPDARWESTTEAVF